MRIQFKTFGSLMALAIPLVFGASVYAQETTAAAPTPPMHQEEPSQVGGPGKGMGDPAEHAERREFREERMKIRADHEQLEAERDKLKAQCMDAKDKDASACEEQKKALHGKAEALHERMKALHEKVQAARGSAGGKEHDGWRGVHGDKGGPAAPVEGAMPSGN